MTIYEELKAAGVEVENHYSDLHCPVNETSTAIIDRRKEENYPLYVQVFKHHVTKNMWYSLPARYDPYWKKVANHCTPHQE
jgi:hypothetical protein